MNGKTKNIIRLIVIIIIAVIIVFAVKIINKNNEMTKMKEAKDNTEMFIKAAKKKYQEENKNNNNWIDVDATALDVENKPEDGTYTIVVYENRIEVLVTNLKFGDLYCQHDGETIECDYEKVKVVIKEEIPNDEEIEEPKEEDKEDGGGISIDGDFDDEEDDMGSVGVEEDKENMGGSITDKEDESSNGGTVSDNESVENKNTND